jgi:hypothetical protein
VLFELLGVQGADRSVRERAAAIHEAYLADRESVDPALAAAAVNVLADSATGEEAAARFDVFWERHQHPVTPQEEMRYLFALARFHDDDTFRRLLDASISEVRTQNAPYLLRVALANRTHGGIAWDFLAEHWDEINARFPSNGIPRMLEGIVVMSDPEVANRVQAFFREHAVPQGTKIVAQHLERQRVHVALREREGPALAAALA